MQNLEIGSLVVKVQALVLSPGSYLGSVQYYFANSEDLSSEAFEFKFKDTFSGQIYLTRSFNLSIGLYREVEILFNINLFN